jgi:glutamate N-acetyltransferase / amino-acid N-acetyltransferase
MSESPAAPEGLGLRPGAARSTRVEDAAGDRFFRSRWVDPPEGVEELDPAELAPGFRAAGVACGTKPGGGLDLGLLCCDTEGVRSAALLTRNAAAAAPVRLCRERAALDALRGVVANSGNANAATGREGYEAAGEMQRAAAEACDLDPSSVAVASTGVIGVPLPLVPLRVGIGEAGRSIATDGGLDFARSIMTTDSGPKLCRVRAGGVTVSAQAKGAGMIEPGFATLLCFVQTDAEVPEPEAALRAAAGASFERITVDGQMSTNDALFLQATGGAGAPLPKGLLDAVLLQLALAVVADGEGASRVARVRAAGAASAEEAERVARAIANSQLVQTAIFGHDPNPGRIVQAAGMALAGSGDLDLGMDDLDAEELAGASEEVELELRLGRGEHSAHVYCSDLTPEYVRINAEYTT